MHQDICISVVFIFLVLTQRPRLVLTTNLAVDRDSYCFLKVPIQDNIRRAISGLQRLLISYERSHTTEGRLLNLVAFG